MISFNLHDTFIFTGYKGILFRSICIMRDEKFLLPVEFVGGLKENI
jgi:hypothetical protein